MLIKNINILLKKKKSAKKLAYNLEKAYLCYIMQINEKRLTKGTPEYEAYHKQLKATAAYQESIFALDEQCREANFARSESEPVYNVEWTVVNGVKVLRCNDSKFIASKNGSRFDVIDIVEGKFICQLTSKEVKSWLIRAAKAETENE